MKTISIAEFLTLLSSDGWQRKQDHEIVGRLDRQVETWNVDSPYPKVIAVPQAFGWASKTSTLDGIVVAYIEGFKYDVYDPASLSPWRDDYWVVEGVLVLDNDGDVLNERELAIFLDAATDFSRIDYSVLEIGQVTDIDVDAGSGMEIFTVEIDNAPNLRFSGKIVARVSSSDNQTARDYSGHVGCWTELVLYKTVGGKFVCHQIDRTRWDDEYDSCDGAICKTLAEIKEFFGHRRLAKELYAEAGIDDVEEVK